MNRLARGVAAFVTVAVCAPAAQAAETSCPARAFSPVFAAWGDNAL